jgi:hypothetical protein
MEQGSAVLHVAPSPHSFIKNGGEGTQNQLAECLDNILKCYHLVAAC